MPDAPDEGQQEVVEPATSTEPVPWAEILEALPESLHTVVNPHLQKYHETLETQRKEIEEKFNPFNPYLEQYGDFNELKKRIEFAQNFEKDPIATYNQIHEWLDSEGLLEEESETPPETPPAEEVVEDEEVPAWLKAQLEAQNTSIAELKNLIESERKNKEEARLQSEFDSYLEGIDKAHPGVPRDYLIAQIAAGKDGVQVAQAYLAGIQAKVNEALKPGEQAPPVLTGGGEQPSTKVPGALNDRETRKALVLQKLQQAAQQNM